MGFDRKAHPTSFHVGFFERPKGREKLLLLVSFGESKKGSVFFGYKKPLGDPKDISSSIDPFDINAEIAVAGDGTHHKIP